MVDDGSNLSATLITDNPDVLLLGLKIQNTRPAQVITISERGNGFYEIFSDIDQLLRQQVSRNIQIMPDLRIFVDDTLYLLKPPIMRYWSRSRRSTMPTLLSATSRHKDFLPKQRIGPMLCGDPSVWLEHVRKYQ